MPYIGTLSGLSVDVSIVLFHFFVRGLETRQRSGSRCGLLFYFWQHIPGEIRRNPR